MESVPVRRGTSTDGTLAITSLEDWHLYATERSWVAGPTSCFRKTSKGAVFLGLPHRQGAPCSMHTAIAMLELAKHIEASGFRLRRPLGCDDLCPGPDGSLLVSFDELAYVGTPQAIAPVVALRDAIVECVRCAYGGHEHAAATLNERSSADSIGRAAQHYRRLQAERIAAQSAALAAMSVGHA
jgi:hypothetical protein